MKLMKSSLPYLVGLIVVLSSALSAEAATLSRWKLNDYPVGTVVSVGSVFKDSVGNRDLVLCAVDPAQADPQYLPVVTNGFPECLRWIPAAGSATGSAERVDHALWFRGGGTKGYYLRLADADGALKSLKNLTIETFVRSVGETFSGAWISMPAWSADGSWGETNVFQMTSSLSTWPGFKGLVADATKPTGYNWSDKSWNGSAYGNYLTDNWYYEAFKIDAGTAKGIRDYTGTYATFKLAFPDNTAPFLFGGTLQGSSLTGCLAELRLSDVAMGDDSATQARLTYEGSAHGTVFFHANYDSDLACHGTDVDGYYNQTVVYNPKAFEQTTAVQARYVHPGKAKPDHPVENGGALVIGNGATNVSYGVKRELPWVELWNYTMEFFVRIDAIRATGDFPLAMISLYDVGNANDSARCGVYCKTDGRLFAKFTASSYVPQSSSVTPAANSINDGRWHHVALTVKTDVDTGKVTFKIFIDHVERMSNTVAQWYPSWYKHDRGLRVNLANGFAGAIDELRLSSGQLDPMTEMLWQNDHLGLVLIFK